MLTKQYMQKGHNGLRLPKDWDIEISGDNLIIFYAEEYKYQFSIEKIGDIYVLDRWYWYEESPSHGKWVDIAKFNSAEEAFRNFLVRINMGLYDA